MTSLQEWADSQVDNAKGFIKYEDQFIYIDWRHDESSESIGSICMEKRANVLYIISFMLDESIQKRGIYKSAAVFIPQYARDNGYSQLAVISANALMRDLLAKCGFKRGQDPDDYFVDISQEDSPPELYGLSKP